MSDAERKRWLLLGSLVALSALGNAYLIVPASVLPVVMRELAIDATAAGWVVSAVFGAQILTSVPSGLALDRFDERAAVALAVGGLVVAGLWGSTSAASGDYTSLVASRLLGGTAVVVVWNAGVTVIGGAFDAESRATAVGAFTAAAPAGFALGHLTGPFVAAVDWTATFAVYGLLAVLPLAVFWFSAPSESDPATARTASARSADSEAGTFSRVLHDRTVPVLCATNFAVMSVYVFLNSWMPTFLAADLGAPLATGGVVVALLPATGILSRTGGGVVSDRLFDGRRRPVVALSFLVPLPLLAALSRLSTVVTALVALVLAGFFVQLAVGVLFTAVRELVEPSVAGTAVATVTMAGSAGAFSAPLVAGALIDATGSFTAAFAYGGLVGLGGLGLAYVLPEPDAPRSAE